MTSLRRSYQVCSQIAQKKARNFFYAFLLLPKSRRRALCAIYAFMRHSDDLVDQSTSSHKASDLKTWRQQVQQALEGGETKHPLLPAFVDTVTRFSIPHQYFFDLLDGIEMDLSRSRYQNFDELYQYCYRVASVVGLVCLYIFGFQDPKALSVAEATGIAFQLTNILRDIHEDALTNRIYLPLEDLKRFRYPEENLIQGVMDDHLRRLVHFEIERARDYYHQAEELIMLVHPDCRRALCALMGIYRSLLEKINEEHERIFEKRIRLSMREKVGIVIRAWRNPLAIAGIA